MSRISSMARFRVAAALEEERKKEQEEQQMNNHKQPKQREKPEQNGGGDIDSLEQLMLEDNGGPSTSGMGRRERLPSVAKFLSARRRSKSHSRLLDSSFFLRIVSAFEQQSNTRRCCHHVHIDDSLCGRFMRRQWHGHHPNGGGQRGGGTGGANGPVGPGRLNGTSAISGWDLAEEGGDELYSLQMDMPIKVLNGSPGYINILDGLNAWQLVSELAEATGQPAAASFKHVSPAGAAIGVPLNESEAQSLMVADFQLDTRKPSLAAALVRARDQNWRARTLNARTLRRIIGADRMSSFGDFIALSHKCDELTARLICREVSDGLIAPDYEEPALSQLAKKKNGNYIILKIDPKYLPAEDEVRTIFGLKLKQKRNTAALSTDSFTDVAIGSGDEITAQTVDDLLVACVAVKYTQSNAVCFVHRGQVVGMGAGQQNRLNCTRLAGEKTANWWLRQHPRVLALPWRANVRRAEKANIVDTIVAGTRGGGDEQAEQFLEISPRSGEQLAEANERQWNNYFTEPVRAFTQKERRDWLAKLRGVCLASESPLPGRECLDVAKHFGAKFIVTPSGGPNDEEVYEACEQHGMVLIHTMEQQQAHQQQGGEQFRQ